MPHSLAAVASSAAVFLSLCVLSMPCISLYEPLFDTLCAALLYLSHVLRALSGTAPVATLGAPHINLTIWVPHS